ncbi:MAG: PaaI family thioesterase [Paludibacteraceae bacterium]|nr:PaaI family thioesterase [Paludibacteraceae bacterium]
MREIINPWVDMQGYNCFGCSPANPKGMRMHFYEEDENDIEGDILSVWHPTSDHQSWINTLHGGIQATLLDEVCGWVVFKKLRTSGVTAKMEIRYRQAVSTINGPLLLKARLKSNNHRVAVVQGEIWSKSKPESEFQICAIAECTYFTFNEDKAKEMGFVSASLSQQDYTLQQVIERTDYKPIGVVK